ncbi:MAG: hypothetical protein WCT08_05590 [Patescibacteria group bacterium]|jgi:hypothetical protein
MAIPDYALLTPIQPGSTLILDTRLGLLKLHLKGQQQYWQTPAGQDNKLPLPPNFQHPEAFSAFCYVLARMHGLICKKSEHCPVGSLSYDFYR